MMQNNRVKISSIVDSQLPLFVREDYPLVSELLTEYYRSLDSKSSCYDILQNIDQYVKVNNLTNLVEDVQTTSQVGFLDESINVTSTEGFPNTYGLIGIGNEIILYKSKTKTSFDECTRGFSGITEYSSSNSDQLSFSVSDVEEHISGSKVINLSSVFLKEFFNKLKKQFAFGFEGRELNSKLNRGFLFNYVKDFYSSKGTDRSFEILFRILYGKDVDVIIPSNNLIKPSSAKYRVTRDIVVEPITGDINSLANQTIYQNQYDDIPKSFGTVNNVRRLVRNEKEYYVLSLDYDFDKDINVSGSIFGDLKIHPKTFILDNVSENSNTIIVDSTVGFPSSGELVVREENSYTYIQYTDKTLNQFLNCSGINKNISAGVEIFLNTYAYGYFPNTNNEIRFRISGVLSDIDIPEKTILYGKDDIIKILSLGYNKKSFKDNNWIFNKSVKSKVKSLTFDGITPDGGFKYAIETFDDVGIYSGNDIEIEYYDNTGLKNTDTIKGVKVKIPSGSIPGKEFQIETDGYEISEIITVKRLVSKFSDIFASDVLNVYNDFDNDILYVASSSLPSYGSDYDEQTIDFSINLSGTFSGEVLNIGNHGFLTGDAVVYSIQDNNSSINRLSIDPGIYFVKTENKNEIRLSRSKSDIYNEKFVSIASTTIINSVDNTNKISLLKFSKKDNLPSKIDSQKLIKSIENPVNDGKQYKTNPGPVGILVNGVELINYKSKDIIQYGAIKSIDVVSGGKNYDIINPPILNVTSEVSNGSSCKGHCWIDGSLERIDLVDGGFDYIETPIINISGGNGFGAKAIAKMISYDNYVDLNSTISNSRIDLNSNQIGFSTYHRFRDGESIFYFTNNNQPIGGLSNESKYYVKVIDEFRVNLHKTYEDSIVGINSVQIDSYGIGNHRFQSTDRKLKVNSIIVTESGQGYKTGKISVPPVGINTANNTVNTYQNPFNSGDIVYYYGGEEENILGLTTGKYIATKVDDYSFKLSEIGTGNLSSDFYYKTNQYVDFKNSGLGNHIFDYEPIDVQIIGKSGISSITSNIDFSAKLNPVFRGEISSIYVYDGGVGYGSSEIINYNKQPKYTFGLGEGAEVFPIIVNGSIDSVVINKSGSGYNSTPDLLVKGTGIGAILTPIIVDGEIVEIKVINGGGNYDPNNTFIEVLTPGRGAELKFFPQIWTLNNFNRLVRTGKISENDSVVYESNNTELGLQYSHMYAPRPLRKRVFSKTLEDGVEKFRSDYDNDYEDVKYHSPIIGWAYDGNPIYGPYGYTSLTDKKIKQVTSGYLNPVDNQKNRPNRNIFPAGYFVEDYIFSKNNDLDEHNGRYCITPEFPNGTYAYFMTLESEVADSGDFKGHKIPKFPYVIGNTFKSKPIDFNFERRYDQNKFISENKNIIRNTFPNNTLSSNSTYEYFLNSDDLNGQNIKITDIQGGKVDSVKIISGGENYKVGDRVIFNNENTGGDGASAVVSHIKGNNIVSISQTSISVGNCELYPTSNSNELVGFTSVPHRLNDNEIIFIDSLSDYDLSINDFVGAKIKKNSLTLSLGVADSSVTGIVTYFYVSGSLDYPVIRENDILKIDSEEIKVLNIDKKTSRIRVLRGQNSTVASTHSAYSILNEDPRRFVINLEKPIKEKVYQYNKELYFNPQESLGIGTIIGIGYTLVFSSPGIDIPKITIPEKTIYIKDHGLNTGDKLIYRINDPDGVGITVSNNGNDSITLENNSILYATRFSNDLIGISTVKVDFGTEGEFVGISQTASTLYLKNSGIGSYHSFATQLDNVLIGQVLKNTITVSTGSTHSLKINDSVNIVSSIGISTTIILKYSDYHRRIVVNPRDFDSVDVDIENNLITIENHGFFTGQKLIHTSDSPSTGLIDNGIYYSIVFNDNQIKLSDSYYGAIRNIKESIVDITTSSYGTLSQINPKISIIKNQNIIFDLSDSSLSDQNLGETSSFRFDLFKDDNFYNRFEEFDSEGISAVNRYGNVGIDSFAKVEVTVNDNFPNTLWYNLSPISNLPVKNQLIVDKEVDNNNKISLVSSNLNGNKVITGITSTSFTFNGKLDNKLKNNLQNEIDGSFRYYTNSKNDTGEIEKINVTTGGISYKNLPKIMGVNSDSGSGSILIPQSNSIGKINSYEILDIGYDYPSDYTLKPYIKFPTILRLEPLSTIDSIEVIYSGLNYTSPPDLILIDGFTDKVVEEVKLNLNLDKRFVSIISNSKGIYNKNPKIIPINNTNGISISSISYENSTKIVRAYLKNQFSDPDFFPFSIGDEVLIEGVSIIPSLDRNLVYKGYNSKSYNYATFEIVGIQTSLGGGNAYIEYSLIDYLKQNETAGDFDSDNSSGRIIPKKYFPKFKTNLRKNLFNIGEQITSSDGLFGEVLRFDKNNEYLFVKSSYNFLPNTFINGQSSKSQALIKDVIENDSFANVGSSSIVNNGWKDEVGFLNNSSQRTYDSDYYQYFSYSLKSDIPFEEWNDVVSNLNHTLGFKKFGDLNIISLPEVSSGISSEQNEGSFTAVSQLNSVVDVECVHDFDLVSENNFYIDGDLTSDEIVFNSTILIDYFESIGNRVLIIDDISNEFTNLVSKTYVTSFTI